MAQSTLSQETYSLLTPFRQQTTYWSLFVFILLFVLLPLFILSFLEQQEVSSQAAANSQVMGVSQECSPDFVDWHTDGNIDVQDYAAYIALFNSASPPVTTDLTCDGVIDEADLEQFLSHWSTRQE